MGISMKNVRSLFPRLSLLIVSAVLHSCDLNTPLDATYDFISSFGTARIQSNVFVAFRFFENFNQGRITPPTTTDITPNGKPVFPVKEAGIGGVKASAIVMIAPAEISFENIRVEYGAWLEFSAGQMYAAGDGTVASLIVESDGKRDTLYRREFHTAETEADRHWFHGSVLLSAYEGKTVSVIFAAGTGKQGNNFGDFVAWQSPLLMQSRPEGTPTGLGAFVAKDWEIGGVRRDAVVTLAGSSATFDLPGSREGEVLYFGAGMKFLLGDGALGIIVCEVEGRRDTVYRRFLSPRTRPDHRHWFDEAVHLSQYRGKDIKLTFSTSPGPADEASADWFAWSTPMLSLPRR